MRRVVVGRATLVRPRVALVYEDGRWNLADAFRSRRPANPDADPLGLRLADVTLVDGSVTTRRIGEAPGAVADGAVFDYTDARLTGLYAQVSLNLAGDRRRLKLSSLRASASRSRHRRPPPGCKGRLRRRASAHGTRSPNRNDAPVGQLLAGRRARNGRPTARPRPRRAPAGSRRVGAPPPRPARSGRARAPGRGRRPDRKPRRAPARRGARAEPGVALGHGHRATRTGRGRADARAEPRRPARPGRRVAGDAAASRHARARPRRSLGRGDEPRPHSNPRALSPRRALPPERSGRSRRPARSPFASSRAGASASGSTPTPPASTPARCSRSTRCAEASPGACRWRRRPRPARATRSASRRRPTAWRCGWTSPASSFPAARPTRSPPTWCSPTAASRAPRPSGRARACCPPPAGSAFAAAGRPISPRASTPLISKRCCRAGRARASRAASRSTPPGRRSARGRARRR